jgi:NADH dehydrogenase
MKKRIVITGVFGNSGGFIAERLLRQGARVDTLTNSPQRSSPLQGRVGVHPLAFDQPQRLVRALQGADVLINNYWVRYEAGGFSYQRAVENTRVLLAAAKKAKVKRVVQVSITNADSSSPYGYFRGKGQIEEALQATGLPHSILRPAVLFGDDEILTNNVAWMLRSFPVFGLFGRGDFRLRPIHVEDLADLAVKEVGATGKHVLNAVGPERPTYREWVKEIAVAMGVKRLIVPMHPRLGWAAGVVMGWVRQDAVLVWEEIDALMQNRIDVAGPATGKTRLSAWLKEAGPRLGQNYRNEIARRKYRDMAYGYNQVRLATGRV